MTTKLLGQGMDPRDDEGEKADTFFFENLELSKDMGVCRNCGEIHGLLRPRGGGRFYRQTCSCENKRGTPQAYDELKKHLNLDFGQAVTLCSCCGQVFMLSGSRWSVFFCDFCRRMIVNFNKTQGFPLIPMGRHSLMNNLTLSGKDFYDEKAISSFLEGTNLMNKRIALLSDWNKIMTAKNLKRIGYGRDPDIDLFSYLSEVTPDFWSQFSAYYGIRKFFLSTCSAVPDKDSLPLEIAAEDSGQKPQKEDYSYYTPEEEIRCVFYTLVARNQAIEKKWRGGFKAYLRKYGREYNDKIAINCEMGFYFERQLIDLADNGLDMNEDFTLFDACATTVQDGKPCKTNADWLGGYFHDGGVMVFMKH